MSTSQCHPCLVQQQLSVQQQAPVVQQDSAQGRDSQQSCLSSRKKRRLEQSQRESGKKTRGETRAVKWNDERSHRLGINPSFTITGEMKRIIGKNADQFIAEVSTWVRSMLPLDCRNWKDMPSDPKKRILNTIKSKWNMPEGDHVVQVVENQCKTLYRQWRYRLKEKYFDGFSIAEAVKNRSENVKLDQWRWIVEKYWGSEHHKRKNPPAENSSQPSDQLNENIEDATQVSHDTTVGSSEVPPLPPPEPEYIRLWQKTKRHKDNSWDTVVEQRLQDFKELHKQQLELYGVDNLTVQEAYMKVLGTTSGYINGLGFGPKAPKRTMEERSNGGGIEIAHQMATQMEQMERSSREREAGLKEQLERESREREAKLKEQLEKESKE